MSNSRAAKALPTIFATVGTLFTQSVLQVYVERTYNPNPASQGPKLPLTEPNLTQARK
jgi:hypothetical protein